LFLAQTNVGIFIGVTVCECLAVFIRTTVHVGIAALLLPRMDIIPDLPYAMCRETIRRLTGGFAPHKLVSGRHPWPRRIASREKPTFLQISHLSGIAPPILLCKTGVFSS
jgi:hypothetical protein